MRAVMVAAHVGVEQHGAAFGAGFDAVHRGIGGAAQHLVIEPMIRIDADADRGRGQDLEPFDQERLLELLQQVFDHPGEFGIIVIAERAQHEQKFVAADAAQDIGGPDVGGYPLRHLDQQRVADGMRIIVVDVLEISMSRNASANRGRPAAVSEKLFNVLLDQRSVRQPGQIVEIGALRQFGLDVLRSVKSIVADSDRA